ncbi:MAG: alpha/beta hydrolase [Deltaproteobacteria bacterium]|nr:alpha/beta hydrolase [Deltaproteobacteria bacterium]
MRALAILLLVLIGCGAAEKRPKRSQPDDDSGTPFGADASFEPVAFQVEVTGPDGARPIVLIPGLACPGEVWRETVEHLGDDYQAHVLTLAGFAGNDPIDEPLSKAVRRDLTRYIRSRKLDHPIIVGHSMGGFIAFWIASYHPDLVGPVIIVDASPALSGGLEEAKELRTNWRKASDEQFASQVRAKFGSMTHNAKRMRPVIDQIAKSDRKTIGDAIYEMIMTDLREQVKEIRAPVLIVAADGGLKGRIREQTKEIPNHEMVVIRGAAHFVMWDQPAQFFKVVDKFLEENPAR